MLLLSLDLPRPLSQGWEAHSDCMVESAQDQELNGPGLSIWSCNQGKSFFCTSVSSSVYWGYKKVFAFHRLLDQANKITDAERAFLETMKELFTSVTS